MDWPAETIGRLRALWAEGHATAEIGRRLGVSKNSIVGKAHRLNLPARPSPIRRDRPPRTTRQAPRAPKVTIPPLISDAAPPAAAAAPEAWTPSPQQPVLARLFPDLAARGPLPVMPAQPPGAEAPRPPAPPAAPAGTPASPATRSDATSCRHEMRRVTPEALDTPAPIAPPAPVRPAHTRPPRQCEFIVRLAARRTDPPLLCEKAADGGRPYCAEHAGICYAKPLKSTEYEPDFQRRFS